MTVANFIIAGTDKAGTTSVYSYLSQHPQVVASRRKETDFFRRGGTLQDYAAYFPDSDGARVVMEASPAYLAEADRVVPRMRALLPDVRLLFILRDPVARFLSSFHFHRAKLKLPSDLTFGEYLDACLAYVESGGDPQAVEAHGHGPLASWYLDVLPFGCYADYLRPFLEAFPRDQIRVMFYEDLRMDARAFVQSLGDFLDLDPEPWDDVDFQPANVTFSGRNRHLHRMAVWVNDRLEPLLRPRPRLKHQVVSLYKRLNVAREGYDGMAAGDRERLQAFYAPHNRELEKLLGRRLPDEWVTATVESPAQWRDARQGAVMP